MTDYYIEDFPTKAIAECSAVGDVNGAVDYWVKKLGFQPDPEAARRTLREYGAWDETELADDEANKRRLLWVMLGDFAEWDGTEDSPYGSDVFSLW